MERIQDKSAKEYAEFFRGYEKASQAKEKEKSRRVYYQDILYSVCTSIEKALGMNDNIVVGTIDEPSTEPQEKIEELAKIKLKLEEELAAAREVISDYRKEISRLSKSHGCDCMEDFE